MTSVQIVEEFTQWLDYIGENGYDDLSGEALERLLSEAVNLLSQLKDDE